MSQHTMLVIKVEELELLIDNMLDKIDSLPICAEEFLGDKIWDDLKSHGLVENVTYGEEDEDECDDEYSD